MSKTSLGTNEFLKSAFQDFVTEEFVSAPNTQIQNRAMVSNSLKSVMGIERVPFRAITALPKEFGASGEPVLELESKDSRVRFVGYWYNFANSYGT